MAYTVGSNLHVAEQGDFDKQVSHSLVAGKEEGETGILYGQSVHRRNEFGIMKGTFGVRKVRIWLSTAWTRVW